MNKIYSDQMTKASLLSDGIRKNADRLQQKGIHFQPERLDRARKALEEMAARQDEAEMVLREIRGQAHQLLDELKELCNDAKTPIKLNFSTEQWPKFGITDKR